MMLPAILVPDMVAQYAGAPDVGVDVHVVALGPVEVFFGTAAECSALLDDWEAWKAAAWRAMMSPVLTSWSQAQVA